MAILSYICLGFVGLVILVTIGWRLVSHGRSLPCPSWLGWLVELDNPVLRSNRASVIIQHLDLQPGMQVLDFGCGPGRLTIPIAKQLGPLGQVTAVDLQPGMLRRVQEKAQAAGLSNIQFLQAEAGEGKLESDRYDRALLVTVLGEIPDQAAALKEIFGALKPGGRLSVTEAIADPHFQKRSQVQMVAAVAGFREKNFFGNRLAYSMIFEKP
jgi:ubiquinone/menaquinone biosynthesis C-methylase UbiE